MVFENFNFKQALRFRTKQQSGGKRSMKDVFRYLYQWSKRNKRPFTMQELPQLLNQSCNIDLSNIYTKWQAAID